MLAKLAENKKQISSTELARASHVLMVLPKGDTLPKDVPGVDIVGRALERARKKPEELAKSPVVTTLPGGGIASWVAVDESDTAFSRQNLLRKGVAALLSEKPEELTIAVFGETARRAAERAVYVAWVNGAGLPVRKKKDESHPVRRISLFGAVLADGAATAAAIAEGNLLARELTVLPANELFPAAYRKRISALARAEGWSHEEYDFPRLRKMGAGAFCAVAQGSPEKDAAIVHLSYPGSARRRQGRNAPGVALVGKGICFDTGGHNLKSAKYMLEMHEDMNGSAVALGILLAASRSKLPMRVDVWLAISRNDISPTAYRQSDVVKALNGDTIEVVHTDAEGRMVLADTLTLASRSKPDVMIDFATLTGSMLVALGSRMSGIFANRDEWRDRALVAGHESGERVWAFPSESDYDEALDSTIADVKQCSMAGEADHILATRFLSRFAGDVPWIHVDLSASRCKGGLGAVGTDVTGFGVAWGMAFLAGLGKAPKA